jgi:hypothetical protein
MSLSEEKKILFRKTFHHDIQINEAWVGASPTTERLQKILFILLLYLLCATYSVVQSMTKRMIIDMLMFAF